MFNLGNDTRKDLRLAKKVITNSGSTILTINKNGMNKPYWGATQNLNYIPDLAKKENIERAFTILGSSDNVFELIGLGIPNIVATDINPFAKHIFYLKKAALKVLDLKEYIGFVLDLQSPIFLDRDLFQKVIIYGFDKEEEKYSWFWQEMFRLYDNETLLNFFFKPDFRFVKYADRQSCMTYTQKAKFYQVKENLDKTKVDIHEEDALETLKQDTSYFMWVDITNILLWVFQTTCHYDITKFKAYLASLEAILRKKLSPNGIIIIDYMFKLQNPKSLLRETITDNNMTLQDMINNIYAIIFQGINEYFDISTLKYKCIPSSINNSSDNKLSDQLVLARLKK